MIELKNIKKYYKMGEETIKALDDVSLKIENGEFVTIIGPSGSGKSTLMNIIGCLDKSTTGEYFIDGMEISQYSENQLSNLRNKKVGFIFQGFNLLQNLSAYENVELPLIYQGVSKSERKERISKALELVGMKNRMKHKPNELSGGQQQRIAIARALATQPKCILADEPTGNLDSATGNEIINILKSLNNSGTTIVIITHNEEIAKNSRRNIKIYDGKIESDELNDEIDDYYSLNLKQLKNKEVLFNENNLTTEKNFEFEKINEQETNQIQEIKKEEVQENIEFKENIKIPRTVRKKETKQENKIIIKSKKAINKEDK